MKAETTIIWSDGEVLRTDRFGRTVVRPSIAPAPATACPVCWNVYCLAIPRDRAFACWKCGDQPRVAPPSVAVATAFDLEDEEAVAL